MIRRGTVLAVSAGIAVLGLTTVGIVFAPAVERDDTAAARVLSNVDARAVSPFDMGARAVSADGDVVAVATYRNAAGRKCVALGSVNESGRFVGSDGREPRAEDIGNCTMRPEPVAFQVVSVTGDARSESQLLIYGLADSEVSSVTFRQGRRGAMAAVDENGGFVLSMPGTPESGTELEMIVVGETGASAKLTLPAPPDPAAIAEGADRARSSQSALHGP